MSALSAAMQDQLGIGLELKTDRDTRLPNACPPADSGVADSGVFASEIETVIVKPTRSTCHRVAIIEFPRGPDEIDPRGVMQVIPAAAR